MPADPAGGVEHPHLRRVVDELEEVAVARDIDLGSPDLTLPTSPADPDMLAAIAEQWGLKSPVERLRETLAR